MRFEVPTPTDLETVAAQLGRKQTRVVGIAARCPAGHPSVVVNYPLRRRGAQLLPFPTLFWLTCPELIKAVSRLEMRGLIAELDGRLETDDDLAAALLHDHESYIAQRWQQLTDEDRAAIEAASLTDVFQQRGIGGIGNLRSVKCLHSHFAHHLASANAIGALLERDHGLHTCEA